jgi:hypothetical protein
VGAARGDAASAGPDAFGPATRRGRAGNGTERGSLLRARPRQIVAGSPAIDRATPRINTTTLTLTADLVWTPLQPDDRETAELNTRPARSFSAPPCPTFCTLRDDPDAERVVGSPIGYRGPNSGDIDRLSRFRGTWAVSPLLGGASTDSRRYGLTHPVGECDRLQLRLNPRPDVSVGAPCAAGSVVS